MVGRWQLPETPSLNLLAHVPDVADIFMVDLGDGELYMHSEITCKEPGKLSNMKRMENVFLQVCLGLYENGMEEVLTFVDPTRPEQERFCEFFGFEETGYLKVFVTPSGEELVRKELAYRFPIED